MDFPLFHLDFFGNRMLIAVIAVLHVFINHALAVGALPLITAMEWWGIKRGDAAWGQLAYRFLFVCFVITTSLGALTGVGIWLSTSLVNPAAIGSLIRIFFAAWFIEWIVFCLEVIGIMLYFLTWKKLAPTKPRQHLAIGIALSAFSWATMALIVAILAFMMDPGAWHEKGTFFSAVLNPVYLPQLAFRTPYAMLVAGLAALFTFFFVARGDAALRARAVRFVSLWVLVWTPLAALGGLWYHRVVPGWMLDHVPVALLTQGFARWHEQLLQMLIVMVVVSLAIAAWGALAPKRLPRLALLLPLLVGLGLLGTFERVREFVRKPYVIADYMYANGIRVADMPLYQEEGMLAHATYTSLREIDPENPYPAGQEVFRLACSRCHTTHGINGVSAKLRTLYGPGPWKEEQLDGLIEGLAMTRPYMPPFPGNAPERRALAHYLVVLEGQPHPLEGAQHTGALQPAGEEVAR